MSARKVFPKTDLSTSGVEHIVNASGDVAVDPEVLPPKTTLVSFAKHSKHSQGYDFGRWYGLSIDEIVYACQRQIERFIDKQDADVEISTIRTYAAKLDGFFDYLFMLSKALDRTLTLSDVNRSLIDGYLGFLRDGGTKTSAQKSAYQSTKAVLKALCARKLIPEKLTGDERTFPANPFPGVHRTTKGEKPLSSREKREVVRALRMAIAPLFAADVTPTSELISAAFLLVALHTGRNTTPLLEMTVDSLRPHPKDGTRFLVLYKRRGHSTTKVALRGNRKESLDIESVGAVKATVVQIIERVIEVTAQLRINAEEGNKNLVWLFSMAKRHRYGGAPGETSALAAATLAAGIAQLVEKHQLRDSDGKPLRLNVSRLRKTFVNRMYELLDGDLVSTAEASGNSVPVVDHSYLTPGEDAAKNWRFMGITLVNELLTGTLGATERTPVARCSDTQQGEYAPKRDGSPCMSFLNCLRCKNLVVTGDDLYRLFSFYWRLLKERARMDIKRWKRQLAHIVRLIEHDVIEHGLSRKVFSQAAVDSARKRARTDPHPFWRADTIIADISEIAT